MKTLPYRREDALRYAARWAFGRNPRYLAFDGIGGDCTNFVSQCLFAGGGVMNLQRDVGWYYRSPTDRAAAWSSVPHLRRFLLENRSVGPFARLATLEELVPGDVVQLGREDGVWYHTLLVTGVEETLLVSAHSVDAHLRPLSSYRCFRAQGLHIEGFRDW